MECSYVIKPVIPGTSDINISGAINRHSFWRLLFAAQLFFRNRFFRQLSVAESFTGFLPIMKDKPHNSI